MRRVMAGLLAVTAVLSTSGTVWAKRVALVIGNGHYKNEAPLANPVNDARNVEALLRQLRFDDVEALVDGDLTAMHQALARFARKADGAEMALLYYSGHGIEVDGRNYLLPTSATLADAADAQFEAVSLDLALEAANRATNVKLVVLDACRNNPFQSRMVRSGRSRSVAQGLGAVTAGNGMLVAYAAKAGTVADDGAPGGNSPFTAAFLKFAAQPGIEVRRLFGLVRDEVLRTTRRQEPGIYASLGGDEVFLARATGAPSMAATPHPAAPPALGSPPPAAGSTAALAPRSFEQQAEIEFWSSVKSSGNAGVLRTYLDKYPNGTFAGLAKARLVELEQQEAALAQAPPAAAAGPPAGFAAKTAMAAKPGGPAPLTVKISGVQNTVEIVGGTANLATGERTVGGVGSTVRFTVSPHQDVTIVSSGVKNMVRVPSSLRDIVKFTAEGVDNKIAYD